MIKTHCPNCGGKLEATRLMCSDCHAEYPISHGFSPYDYLSDAQSEFLEVFLKCKGSLKAVGETLDISYPSVRKRLDEVLVSLGFAEKDNFKEDQITMPELKAVKIDGDKASQIIQRKLLDAGGSADIPLLGGGNCRVVFSKDIGFFTSDKLDNYKIDYSFYVFDIIVELLKKSPAYKAPKGLGRGKDDKVGFGKCTEDTVVGTIAVRYFGKKLGESTYDPVFVLAAMLEWAGIAHNLRGYVQLADDRFVK